MPRHDTHLWQMWAHANIAWYVDLSKLSRNTFTNLWLCDSAVGQHDPTQLIDLTITLICQDMMRHFVANVVPWQYCMGYRPLWVGLKILHQLVVVWLNTLPPSLYI